MPKDQPEIMKNPAVEGESNIDATQVSDQEMFVEEGGSGTIISSGILSNVDYNPKLTGLNRLRIYDEMRLGDSTVRQALLVCKLPIISASWFFKPASDSDSDKKIKDFVESQLLRNPQFSWNVLLRQILTFEDYGNSVFEKVYEVINEGDYRGFIGWKKISQRLVKTIQRWTLEDGVSPGIVQHLPSGKKNKDGKKVTRVEIPRWKMLYFILEQEGSNYEGISLLRAAYKHWYYKNTYYQIDSIATERQGLGIPIVSYPPNARPEDKRKAREVAKNLRTNSQAYADLPQGFTMNMLDMKANSIKNPENMINHHDRQIMKNVLAAFMELGGQGSSGSYSLGDVQAEFFYLSIQYIAGLIREEIQHSVKELVDLNFGKQKQYPTLQTSWIGKLDLKALSEALKAMIESDVVIPDMELERHMRQTFHLPEATYMQVKNGEKLVDPREKRESEKVNDKEDDQPEEKPMGKKKPAIKAAETSSLVDFVDDTESLLAEVNKVIHAKESA